jgi:hypothetical protein
MQVLNLFDTSDKRGRYDLTHNIGSGGAVVLASSPNGGTGAIGIAF